MEKLMDAMNRVLQDVFVQLGYPTDQARVGISNRPDLCEYQCNGAMALAKALKKKPMEIAGEIAGKLTRNPLFEKAEAVMPGFINIDISKEALCGFLERMQKTDRLGAAREEPAREIIVDYGGANVAKPLHVGHLRSAVIGESIKRLGAFFGNKMIGDVHLGDWGLQMGLIIEELRDRKPELPYFSKEEPDSYPKTAPFTLAELEEIYPAASAKSKTDEAFKERARLATLSLQRGDRAFVALWQHIMRVSLEDLKKNYDRLDVHFEIWKGESDAAPYIPALIRDLEERGIAYVSEGALVVDIAMETDPKELPPCIIRKSDGAALYATSDLGTLVEREKLYAPDTYIYIADKRQELHYTQFFRVAKKAGIVASERDLTFIGFGTMNGSDGKPFKTREGGVMRLEALIGDVYEAVHKKIMENRDISPEEARETADIVSIAALKYADLSNQASKDYIFDVERFTSFEGNTGPYLLYTIVRINSILAKYRDREKSPENPDSAALAAPAAFSLLPAASEVEKRLGLELSRFPDTVEFAWKELAPHRVCQYLYTVSDTFNRFYHEVKILSEEDESRRRSYLALIRLVREVLLTGIDLLGIRAPEKM